MANSTNEDAARRIWYARPGSMIEASESYLVELRAQLHAWLADVDAELTVRREDLAAGTPRDNARPNPA